MWLWPSEHTRGDGVSIRVAGHGHAGHSQVKSLASSSVTERTYNINKVNSREMAKGRTRSVPLCIFISIHSF